MAIQENNRDLSDWLLLEEERRIRVFISSTFRDMMPERELLLKRIFPQLHKLCKERHIELTEVDLRWGITDEEAQQGRVLDICLTEIDRSRPFFIGILGDRYGWVPSADELKHQQKMFENFPWLEHDLKEGLSVTDIEMQYGVLRNPMMAGHAFFYIKTAGTQSSAGQQNWEEAAKLVHLKKAVRAQAIHPVRNYKSMDALGEAVYNDIKAVIDRLYPLSDVPDTLKKTRLEHIAYIKSRTAVYVPNIALFNLLDQHVDSCDSPLVLCGGSGTGKSALLANWLVKRHREHPKQAMIFHFCGCNADSSSPLRMMTRLLEELKASFLLSDEIPTDFEGICEALPLFLAQTGGEGSWILVLDAIDQLTEEGVPLSWLPEEFPSFVRVILSTVPGDDLIPLQRRGWRTVEMPVMDKQERHHLISRYLGQYGKKLESQIEDEIAGAKLSENPLTLRAMLDELRIFGLHEGLHAQVQAFLSVPNSEAFFTLLLQRLELDFDTPHPGVVRNLLITLWAAKKGMAEQELIDIHQISRLLLSQLLASLDHHLIHLGGLLCFSHSFLRSAVESHYLSTDTAKRQAHKQLGAYFSAALPQNDPRVLDELPYQYAQAKKWRELRDFLGAPISFQALFTRDPYALALYWKELDRKYSAAATYRNTWREEASRFTTGDCIRLTQHFGEFLELIASFAGAIYFYRLLLNLCRKLYGEDSLEAAQAYGKLGGIYNKQNKFGKALYACKKSLALQSAITGETAATIDNHNVIANIYWHRGDYPNALKENQIALSLSLRLFGATHAKTAHSHHEIGWVYEAVGQYEKALESLLYARNIYLKLYGENHPQTASCCTTLAWVYDWLGNYAQVMVLAEKSVGICEAVYGLKHPETGQSRKLLGTAFYRIGDYQAAFYNYEQCYHIFAAAYGRCHTRISAACFQLGLASIKLGAYAKAIEWIEESTRMEREISGGKVTDLAINYNHLGLAYTLNGDYDKGLANLERGYADAMREYGEQSNDVAENHYYQGIYYDRVNQPEHSLLHHNKALVLRRAIYGNEHPETGISLNALAKLLLKANRTDEAAIYSDTARNIFTATGTEHLADE